MRARRGKLGWSLALVAGFLVVLAVVSGVVYLALRQGGDGPNAGTEPLVELEPNSIQPELALYPLAGASDLDAIDAGIDNHAPSTAFATLAFSSALPDAQRIGRLLLLGERFSSAGQADSADRAYRQVYDMAVLSPQLNDPARADALLATGKGWGASGNKEAAIEAYDQAYVIATRSPYLQMSQRRSLLGALAVAYADRGEQESARASRDRVLELDQETDPRPPLKPVGAPDLSGGEEVVSTPELGALEEARRQAAYAVLQAVSEGGETPADLVEALAEALRTEDSAKLGYFQQELDSASQSGRRVHVQRQLIRWLLLKYQVASKGFGMSLVPEWEAAKPEIQSSLAKAQEGIFFDREDLVTGLPDASLVAPALYRGRAETILAGRRGHYPNFPMEQLAGKLQDAAMDMIASGTVEPLYVDVQVVGDDLRLFLSPADQYGRAGETP